MRVKVKNPKGLKFYRGYISPKIKYGMYTNQEVKMSVATYIFVELEAIQRGHIVEVWSSGDQAIYRFTLHHTNAITKAESDRFCRTALTLLGIK